MLHSLVQEMRQNPLLVASLAVFTVYVFIGAAAPVLAPYDPNIQNLRATLAPPSSLNLLGADEYGRDLLSRLIYGTRSSMIVGAAVVVCSALIGMVLGILSGYRGGFLDDLIMRSSDVMMAFPFLVLALGLIAALGAGLGSTIIALTAAFAPIYVRIVRGCVLQIRQEAYVDAARIMGVGAARIGLRHVVPNVMGPVLVQGALTFAFAVLAEASLSFVGLGIPPPDASFGNIIAAGRDYIAQAWWISTLAGISIVVVVLALLVIADGLRDAIDPYQHRL